MVIFGYVIIGLSIIGLIICFTDFDAGAPVIILLVLVFALGLAFINHESLSKVIQAKEQEQVKQGGYYLNQCKLLEVNVDNGFFRQLPINLTVMVQSLILTSIITTSWSVNIKRLLKNNIALKENTP